MTHAYEALMDSLAALAVEAVRNPATAALGRRVLVVQADLGEAAAVRQMFAQVCETFGVLDIPRGQRCCHGF